MGAYPDEVREKLLVTERELLALIYFLRHFRSYLLGRPFIVHAALKWIQQFKEPEGQIARWLEYLQEFDFQTGYRPGKVAWQC